LAREANDHDRAQQLGALHRAGLSVNAAAAEYLTVNDDLIVEMTIIYDQASIDGALDQQS